MEFRAGVAGLVSYLQKNPGISDSHEGRSDAGSDGRGGGDPVPPAS
jgi:hypothetical protein